MSGKDIIQWGVAHSVTNKEYKHKESNLRTRGCLSLVQKE